MAYMVLHIMSVMLVIQCNALLFSSLVCGTVSKVIDIHVSLTDRDLHLRLQSTQLQLVACKDAVIVQCSRTVVTSWAQGMVLLHMKWKSLP